MGPATLWPLAIEAIDTASHIKSAQFRAVDASFQGCTSSRVDRASCWQNPQLGAESPGRLYSLRTLHGHRRCVVQQGVTAAKPVMLERAA